MSDQTYVKIQTQQKTLTGSSPGRRLLQRTCVCGGLPGIDGLCTECRNKWLTLQRSRRGFEAPSVSAAAQGNAPAQEHVTSSSALVEKATRFSHDFSQIPVYSSRSPVLQTKLIVSQPGDIYEQEADRVAEQVMRMADSEPSVANDEDETKNSLMRKESRALGTNAATDSPDAPPIVHAVLSSGGGQPLDAATQAFMEPRFGHNFSQVSVHTDAKAAESASAVNALAYTVGKDVVFGAGQYSPWTIEGKRLLAHELMHVVQQQSAKREIMRQQPNPHPPASQPIAQTEWNAHPTTIQAHYHTWQDYEKIRNTVASWTNPSVSPDPASYIDAAIKEWDDNPGIHVHFGEHSNNFDGDAHRSYLNLRRLYQGRGIANPANYFATNIVDITFYNRTRSGHKDLQTALNTAQTTMTAAGHAPFVLDTQTFSFVPRTFNDNINELSNHALGKAIDINPGTKEAPRNPQITSADDWLVIDAICSPILPKSVTSVKKETDYVNLKAASDYFQQHFNAAWVTAQENSLTQMQGQHPPPTDLPTQQKLVNAIHKQRGTLDGYAARGFLDLPADLVAGLLSTGRLKWGGEWDIDPPRKDFMHFELKNP